MHYVTPQKPNMKNQIKPFNSIEEMNDDDLEFILQMTFRDRIKYFQTINEMFYKDGSELRAHREYYRWLSLLDDKQLQRYISLK